MSDDLIERLRDFTEEDAYAMPWTFGAVVREAAAELARLRAEVERLTAALSDERAHADALAEALARIAYQNIHRDTFPRVAFEAYSKHRARRHG